NGVTAFEQIARVIEGRPSTKRAFLPIFAPHDLARAADTNDLPCAGSLHFAFANGTLNSTVYMRANDAAKLLAYNLFEFSLLAECLAARLGVTLGVHVHSAASMHLRDQGILSAEALGGTALNAVGTTRIDRFDDELRRKVLAVEQELRQDAGQPSIRPLIARILANNWEMLWSDILLAALLVGRTTSFANLAYRDVEEIEKYLGHARKDMPITFAELRLRSLAPKPGSLRAAN
ncbi:MAG: thymidylate synthase, partial [Alphaproteobacteria bacterium]